MPIVPRAYPIYLFANSLHMKGTEHLLALIILRNCEHFPRLRESQDWGQSSPLHGQAENRKH